MTPKYFVILTDRNVYLFNNRNAAASFISDCSDEEYYTLSIYIFSESLKLIEELEPDEFYRKVK